MNMCESCMCIHNLLIRIGKKFGVFEESFPSFSCHHIASQQSKDVIEDTAQLNRSKEIEKIISKGITHFLMVNKGMEKRDISILPVGLTSHDFDELGRDITDLIHTVSLLDGFEEALRKKLADRFHADRDKETK